MRAPFSGTRTRSTHHPAAFPEIGVTSAETGLGIATLRALIAEMA